MAQDDAAPNLSPGSEVRPVGFTTKRLAAIDLPAEISDFTDHVLRLSHTTIRPGGYLAAHAHVARPEIIYMLSGVLTETRADRAVDYQAGDTLVMSNGVTHTLENRGQSEVVYLSITVRIP